MKRSLIALCVTSPLLAYVGCALDEPTPQDPVVTGGTSGTAPTGGTAGSGVGGDVATGGTATGGTATGGTVTGGTTTGGSAGMGTGGGLGGAPTGGTAGAGNAGGAAPGGAGGAGGAAPGGAGGAGGAAPGGAGGAGPGGMGGKAGGGGGGSITPESVVPGLDGYTQTYPCDPSDVTDYDCKNTMCVNTTTPASRTVQRDFMVTGDASTTYELTIRVRGVVEAKNYTGGMRRAGTGAMDASVQGGDFLYIGGSAPTSTYNEYSLTVTSGQVSGQPTYYGLNARNGTSEAHQSWALNYTMTLRVRGGGTVRYRMYDQNCRQITNCGADTGSGACGSDQRILTFTGADPMPTGLNQPLMGASRGPGQFIFLDVTSVTVVP